MSDCILRDYVADAQLLIKRYPVEALLIKKYQFTTKKAVWFIKTSQKNYALKKYRLTKEQWRFMISAYNYLSHEVNNVAPLINSKENQPWIVHDDCYYILTGWVKGYNPDYTNNADLEKLTRGIATLHLASQNYILPEKETKLTQISNWPEDTRRRQGLLLEYRYEAENLTSETFAKTYLKHFSSYFELYEESAEVFESVLYKNWVKKIKETPCLCVNSFSPSNFSLGETNKVWLLHLDNICINLPARDLRKLIFKVMYINGKWCTDKLTLILKNYLELYPLTEGELKILLAELKIPHLFMNVSSKYFLNKKPQWSKEKFTSLLNRAIKFETEKANVLSRFWRIM